MLIDLIVPEVGESIHEVQVLRWKKQPGDWVDKDEEVVEIETEKATVPVPSPAAGRLQEILKQDSEFVEVGDALARLEAGDGAGATSNRPSEKAAVAAAEKKTPEPTPAKAREPASDRTNGRKASASERASGNEKASGGREPPDAPRAAAPPPPKPKPATKTEDRKPSPDRAPAPAKPTSVKRPAAAPAATSADQEQRVPMSLLRRTIARRLVEAQQNAALVSTFNEIDMQAVIDLRREYAKPFQEEYDVKLGFMSFFVKAAVEGLKRCPEVNAMVDGETIVYRNHYDIGVAIGSGKGLVVPVLRNAERMSFAEIERQIADFAARAQDNRLAPAELEGGTFTISNGGIYGSLLSTPIVNPPQSGVLGLHAIQERPVARNGQVVIRPMMYVALTYDHRLIDGREAVTFLKRIKDVIETPSRLFLEI